MLRQWLRGTAGPQKQAVFFHGGARGEKKSKKYQKVVGETNAIFFLAFRPRCWGFAFFAFLPRCALKRR